jgi:hypothetical protein
MIVEFYVLIRKSARKYDAPLFETRARKPKTVPPNTAVVHTRLEIPDAFFEQVVPTVHAKIPLESLKKKLPEGSGVGIEILDDMGRKP